MYWKNQDDDSFFPCTPHSAYEFFSESAKMFNGNSKVALLYMCQHGKAQHTDTPRLTLRFSADVSYYCLRILRHFQGKFLSVLPRPCLSGSNFCAIISKQLKFQFFHSSDASRSRFVMAFCPGRKTHFSGKQAAKDRFGRSFDFGLPRG